MLNQSSVTTLTVLLLDTASISDPTGEQEIVVPGRTSPVHVSLAADPERTAATLRQELAPYGMVNLSVGSALCVVGVETTHAAQAGLRYVDIPVETELSLRDNHAAILAGVAGVVSSKLIL